MSDSDFQISPISESSYTRLAEMFQACFGKKVGNKYFSWKYVNNPAGEVVGYEATSNGKPAAFYGVIPEYYRVRGQKKKIFQSMDTMTHPDFRKRGLFVRLAQLTYNRVHEISNRKLLIGIPGIYSIGGFVKRLNWENTHTFRYIFVYRKYFFLRHFFLPKNNLSFVYNDRFDQSIDHYFNTKEAGIAPIEKYFDSKILNWKVIDNPNRNYKHFLIYKDKEIIGFIVYHQSQDQRVCIDYIDFKKRSLFKLMPDIIREVFKKNSAQTIYTWEPQNQEYRSGLRKCGFFVNPFDFGPFHYRIPFIVHKDETELDGIEWSDPKNFNLQPLIQD